MIRVRRALLSVSDKRGLVPLATALRRWSVELLSTGGTAQALRAAGLPVTDVATVTGQPEMLDGRVKSLHPAIHAGILAVRGNAEHGRQLAAHGLEPIDLVAVNLYPFEATLEKPDLALPEAVEQIDIGGPALLRSAAKNFEGVAAVADPDDYPALLAELDAQAGGLSRATRFRLARKAFAHTARYDALIAGFLEGRAPRMDPSLGVPEPPLFPPLLHVRLEKVQDLRYGENPHQRAALYRQLPARPGVAAARQLQGKELSYNNLLDVQAAWALVQDLEEPAVVIVKHTNPCGVGVGADQAAAFLRARDTDPVSAFGGIVAVNRRLEGATAEAMAAGFLEVVVAPAVSGEARDRLRAKGQLRILEAPVPAASPASPAIELRQVAGGVLAQEPDGPEPDPEAWRPVTRRPPGAAEHRALRLAWRVAKHVKSNAIVLATPDGTVGVGAGQMSRVDAVRLAVSKAVLPTAGTVLASDAFFPFRDGVDAAAAAGVTAIVQPGGSVRDAEAVAAADEHGMAMVFTGIRHFRH